MLSLADYLDPPFHASAPNAEHERAASLDFFNVADPGEVLRLRVRLTGLFKKPVAANAALRLAELHDDELDKADRSADRRVQCPVLFLWGAERGFGGTKNINPLSVWRHWASAEVSGGPLACGHFLPEEAPDLVVQRLLPFLAAAND